MRSPRRRRAVPHPRPRASARRARRCRRASRARGGSRPPGLRPTAIGPRRSGIEAEQSDALLPGRQHGLVRNLELAEHRVVRRKSRRARASRSRRARRRSSSLPRGRPGSARRRSARRVSSSCSVTPASRSPARASSAIGSPPTAATIVTSAPSRAHATAWFAPLPPGTRANVAPPTVSPGSGSRSRAPPGRGSPSRRP